MWSFRRPLALATVLLSGGLLVGACGSSSSSSQAGSPSQTSGGSQVSSGGSSTGTKIGFINLNGQMPYAVFVLQSMESAAKRAHVQLVSCDSRLSIQQAITCAQLLKSQGVKGIANFQGNQAASPRICAAGPKVPVVAVDIPQMPCQNVYFGANNYQTGYLGGVTAGTYAKQHWNCQIDTAVNFNTPINKLILVREQAETAGLKSQCPNVKVTNVTPTAYTTDDTIAPFTNKLSALPGQHHIVVLGINDDVAIGAVKAAQSAGRLNDLYVVGQGGDPTSWPYLCGKSPFKNWIGEVGYFPQRYGDYVVPTLLNLIKGKKEPSTVYLKPHVITPKNIRSYYPAGCK